MHSSQKSARIAAIDIGTVTCRLLIADIDEKGHLSEVYREVAIVNLGEGVDTTGMLSDEAMERTVSHIARYRTIIGTYSRNGEEDIDVIAVATSAARDAKNSDTFIRRLAEKGITLSIIPGDKEAELSFLGASSSFTEESLLVVDIGGGSTELIAGSSGKAPTYRHSFDVGCRRMTEKFLSADPPTAKQLSEAKTWARTLMEAGFRKMHEKNVAFSRMVAVAGTATSVVSISKHMEHYDPTCVHKVVVNRDTFEDVYRQLRNTTLEERKRIAGLEPKRAGVIVAGMVILETVMELAEKSSFTVSETDILHGIILDHGVQ